MRRKIFSITASSTISELFDCSAVSHMTGASAGRRRTSTLSGAGSKTIWPSGVSMRAPSASETSIWRAKTGSEKASVKRPMRRPRRTRASASCDGRAALDSSSQDIDSGSCQRLVVPSVLTSTSASSMSRSPPSRAV